MGKKLILPSYFQVKEVMGSNEYIHQNKITLKD
jgi:hypothetical protein